MKTKTWLPVLLIIACLGVFGGYWALDKMNTDTEAPEIRMDAQIPEISVSDPKSALLQGISASDNTDGDVTASVVVESISLLDVEGRLMVGYAAFDSAGNVAKQQREARYTDYESPRFTLAGPLLYRYGTSFDVLATVGASDVIDGEIQHRVRATSLVETSIAEMGTHDVRFQVTNSLGDTVSMVFPVEIYDPTVFEASLTLNSYLVYLRKGEAFSPVAYLGTFSLMGDTIPLQGSLPANYALKTNGTVDTQTPGVYPVEFRVTYTQKHETDPNRDRQYTGYSKLIVVVEG